MTFTAVGSTTTTEDSSLPLSPQTAGDFILLASNNKSAAAGLDSVSGGGCTWARLGTRFVGTNTAYTADLFIGTVVTPGTYTVTLTYGDGGTFPDSIAQEFNASTGAWVLQATANLDANTATCPTLAPAGAGELYWIWTWENLTPGSPGPTPGYTYFHSIDFDWGCYNPSCVPVPQAPVLPVADNRIGIAALLREPSVPLGWSIAQSAGSGTGSASTLAATYGSNVSAGNKLIAYATVAASAGAPSVTGVADGSSNAFTLIKRIAGTHNDEASIWARDVPAGDAGTKPVITATASRTTAMSLVIHEAAGLLAGNTTAMCDGTAATLTGSTTATGSPSYTTTAPGEFLVSLYGDFGDNFTVATAAGWTPDLHNVNDTGASTLVLQYKNSTGGAETDGFTSADTSNGWEVIEVAFRLAAAPSGLLMASFP